LKEQQRGAYFYQEGKFELRLSQTSFSRITRETVNLVWHEERLDSKEYTN